VTATLTVTNNLQAQFVCAPNQTNDLGANCTVAVPAFTNAVTFSPAVCASMLPITVTQSPTVGTAVGVGTHAVTLTATDSFGHQATCVASFVVTGTPPALVTDPLPLGVQAGEAAVLQAAKVLTRVATNASMRSVLGLTSVGGAPTNGTLSTTTSGGYVNTVTYTPTNGAGNDSFSYVAVDCGGLSVTGQVAVTISMGSFNIVAITNQVVGADTIWTIVAQGIPNYRYALLRAASVDTPLSNWLSLATNAAATNSGQVLFTDTNPPPASFYRTRYIGP
jgi:hypothetical protein